MTDSKTSTGSTSKSGGSSTSGSSSKSGSDKNTTKISEEFLTDFAKNKLPGLSSALTTDNYIQSLNEFANASLGQGVTGPDPSGGYSALLPGNPQSTRLPSAAQLQSQFQKLTSTLSEQVTSLSTNATTMAMDLAQVSQVMSDGEDKANISASTMSTDLGNLTISGSSSGGGTSGDTITVSGTGTGGSNTGSSSNTGGSNSASTGGSTSSTTTGSTSSTTGGTTSKSA
jgi:hypothetical protein